MHAGCPPAQTRQPGGPPPTAATIPSPVPWDTPPLGSLAPQLRLAWGVGGPGVAGNPGRSPEPLLGEGVPRAEKPTAGRGGSAGEAGDISVRSGPAVLRDPGGARGPPAPPEALKQGRPWPAGPGRSAPGQLELRARGLTLPAWPRAAPRTPQLAGRVSTASAPPHSRPLPASPRHLSSPSPRPAAAAVWCGGGHDSGLSRRRAGGGGARAEPDRTGRGRRKGRS